VASERFLTLSDVAEVLNISASQTYALVRNKELKAIKIGGRGQYRVERDQLESFIARMYDETEQYLTCHPFVDAVGPDEAGGELAGNITGDRD
jgi:excisionase family DNA binding protein